MKSKLITLLLLVSFATYSQQKETVYVTVDTLKDSKKSNRIHLKDLLFAQFDLSTPLVLNTNRGETYTDGTVDKNWFIPNGIGAKFGIGIQPEGQWIGLSMHTGLDWKANPKMVVVPFYTNLRLAFYITDSSKINLQAGFGKGVALGRGALYGDFQRYVIGIENEENFSFFVELSGYNFKKHPIHTFGSISLGVSFRSF